MIARSAMLATSIICFTLGVARAASPPTQPTMKQFVADRPARPLGFDGDLTAAAKVKLVVTNQKVYPIGDGKFAILLFEQDVAGGHSDPGAVSIIYGHKHKGAFVTEKKWPEFIWAGNSGTPPSLAQTLPTAHGTLAVLSSTNIYQGESATTAWVVGLGSAGPAFEGYFPLAGAVGKETCSNCKVYSYEGMVSQPRIEGNLLAVTYRGWESAPAQWPIKHPFVRRTEYGASRGEMIGRPKINLPG